MGAPGIPVRLLILLSLVATQSPGGGDVPRARVVYSADTAGHMSVCGCAGGQYGGLARRGALLLVLGAQGRPSVVVDSGPLSVGDARQAAYFAEAYGAMGYDLVLPSGADLTLKTDDGRTLADELTKNGVGVLDRPAADGDGPLPTKLLDAGNGWGVLVLAGPDDTSVPLAVLAARAKKAVEGFRAEGAASGAPTGGGQGEGAASSAPTGAGTVIVLATRLPYEQNQRLAELLGDTVDVIVGAGGESRSRDYRDPIADGRAVPAIAQGKALTVIDVTLDENGAKRIEARFEPVAPGLLEDSKVKEIVDRYYTEAAPASRPAEPPDETVDYVLRGWADAVTCGECHPKELEVWQGTLHAQAIPTLEKAGRLVDECLECHSETFRRQRVFDPEHLVPGDGVTCATCHGDGLIHSMTGRTDYIEKKTDAQACMACHNEERQPAGFDFEASWAKIRHGAATGTE